MITVTTAVPQPPPHTHTHTHTTPPSSAPFLHPPRPQCIIHIICSHYLSTNLLNYFCVLTPEGPGLFGIMFKTQAESVVMTRVCPWGLFPRTVSCTTLISLIGSLNPTAEGQIDIQPASVIRQRQLHILKSFNRRRRRKISAVDDFRLIYSDCLFFTSFSLTFHSYLIRNTQ